MINKQLLPILHREEIAARGLQIAVDKKLRDQLRTTLIPEGKRCLLVGLAWKSEDEKAKTPYSLNILDWEPILRVPGLTFVNLQTGDCNAELAAAVDAFGIPIAHNEILDSRLATNSYATRVAAMDIVVAPDSDAAAIAAAFDIPVFSIILPSLKNTRSSQHTTQVFIQGQSGEWQNVIRDVGLALLDHTVSAGVISKRAPYLRTFAQLYAINGQSEDAELLYRRLAQEPGLAAEALHQIAFLRQKIGQNEDALRLFDEALSIDPGFWHSYNGRGLALASLNRFEDAISSYRQGLTLNPQSGEIHNNLGTSLRCLGHAAEALTHYRQAKELLPNVKSILLNEASALDESGNTEQALQAFEELVSLHPNYIDARYNRSQILLSTGQFEAGWKEFVWRLKRPAANAHHDLFPQPVWQGEGLSGKRILVWTEQGIGDELLTVSMIPDIIDATEHVIILCSKRLIPLIQRSFPTATVEVRAEPLPSKATDPSIDLQMSLSELGMAFRVDFANFPHRQGFLKADQNKQGLLRHKYQQRQPGTRLVGISWMSPGNYEIGWLKSQRLIDWAPILSTPGITFVNLQYGASKADLKRVRDQLGTDIIHDDDIDPLVDMDSFAAQVAAMDLVISVSNTTVHTAGALGIPCWALAAKGRGRLWYWFRGKKNSPWYPSVRFLSQETEGNWAPVLHHCAQDLAVWLSKKTKF